MKEFYLIKFIIVMSIICLAICFISLGDFSYAASFGEIIESLKKPLQLTNWHYAVIVFLLLLRK